MNKTITQASDPKTDEATVKVTGNAAENETFSVTFPADTTLTWGQDGQVKYSVKYQLQDTHRLTVKVAPVSDSTNTAPQMSGVTTNANKLNYKLTGDGNALDYTSDTLESAEAEAVNKYNRPTAVDKVLNVTPEKNGANSYETVPLNDTYQDQLTFTVTVVNA